MSLVKLLSSVLAHLQADGIKFVELQQNNSLKQRHVKLLLDSLFFPNREKTQEKSNASFSPLDNEQRASHTRENDAKTDDETEKQEQN
jgi:hypothetical protein